MIYFVSSSLKKSEKEVLNPIPLTVLSCLFYISCKAFQFLFPVGYFVNAPILTVVLYCFNSIIPMIIIIQVCKVFSKVSKNRQAILEIENTQLDYYANQDALTNLQNRRYFESKLKTSVEKANSESYLFSMLMCDLDDFKKINDTYGHVVGDQVLKNVSQIIQTNIRDFDCAARWGGEEFIILIKGGIPIASLIADRINKAVAASSISLENDEVHYTITIGIAEYSKELTCSKLIEKADANLYIGKRTGKNCVIC
jgi:diguanylate cyclase (GGDEF)-like protein